MTTIDGTKRLPTRILTLPMSAVSRGVQAGMRLQQNIAEMAIKGDEFFAPFCDKPEEQPEWARFDEDEAVISIPAPTPTTPAADPAPAPAPTKAPARKPAAKKAAATEAASAESPATETPAAKTPAKKTPAKKTPAKKAPAKKAPARTPAAKDQPEAPAANPGRFALYSSPPADLAEKPAAPAAAAAPRTKNGATTGKPEIVEYLEYDSLTLAQLRAKLRGLSTDDLQELLDHERATRNRAPFVTMIDNRITSHQKKSGATS